MQNFIKTIINSVQNWTKKQIKESTADWSQNDSSANNYVKNRTHWEEIKEVVILPEMSVTISDEYAELGILSYGKLVAGQVYVVNLNDIKHTCVARSWDDGDSDVSLIGNGTIYGDDNNGNGEPFSCDSYDDGTIYLNAAAGVYTISISVVRTTVHKLDSKYLDLPTNLATTDDIQEAFDAAETAQTTADTALTNAATAQTTANNAQTHSDGVASDLAVEITAREEADATKMDATDPVGTGSFSMNRQDGRGVGKYSSVFGNGLVMEHSCGCVTGKFNSYETTSYKVGLVQTAGFRVNKTVSVMYSSEYELVDGMFVLVNPKLTTYANLPAGSYYYAGSMVSYTWLQKCTYNDVGSTYCHVGYEKYELVIDTEAAGTYAHIVGNGTSNAKRSNAHTLDWDGVGWYAGGLQVGGNAQNDGAKNVLLEGEAIPTPTTATVGQTIRVKAIDDSGKPTEWEAVDLQEKICGDAEEVILPATCLAYASDMGGYISSARVTLTAGETYVVVYNGAEYTCVAADITEIAGEPIVSLGDLSALTGGDSTGEPFLLMIAESEEAEAAGATVILISIDDAQNVVVAIKKGKVEQIDTKFLPGYPWEKEETVLIAQQEVTTADGTGLVEFASIPVLGEPYEITIEAQESVSVCTGRAGLFYESGVAVGIAVDFPLDEYSTGMVLYVYPEYVESVGAPGVLSFGDANATFSISAKRPHEIKPWDQKFAPRADLPVFDLVAMGLEVGADLNDGNGTLCREIVSAARKGAVIFRLPISGGTVRALLPTNLSLNTTRAAFQWFDIQHSASNVFKGVAEYNLSIFDHQIQLTEVQITI